MKNRFLILLLLSTGFQLARSNAKEIKVGLIGLDTSHATAFTGILNDPTAKDYVSGARVVAAVPGGSYDIDSSWTRVPEYTEKLVKQYGVRIHGSIEAMCREVDAVMVLSVDGRPHLAQVTAALAARKPIFVDKPLATSLRDGKEIFERAQKAGVPLFSSSSLRYGVGTVAVRKGSIGAVNNAITGSPSSVEPTHPELFWYGIHGVESLFTVMGTGCESVQRRIGPDGKLEVLGIWSGGRTGTFREQKDYGGEAWGKGGKAAVGTYDGYAPLIVEVIRFFESGVSPVPAAETLEILAFMEAAELSKKSGGAPIKLSDVRRAAGLEP